jgi:hypothetical protein
MSSRGKKEGGKEEYATHRRQSQNTSVLKVSKRGNSERIKTHRLASTFSKDFSNLGLASGFLSQNLRFLLALLFTNI